MQRNNVVTRDMTSITQAALEYKTMAFLQTVREARVGCDYPKEVTGNMDDTPIYFNDGPNNERDKKYLGPDYSSREIPPHRGIASYSRWVDAPTNGDFKQLLSQRSNCCRSRKCIRWHIPVHAILTVFIYFFTYSI